MQRQWWLTQGGPVEPDTYEKLVLMHDPVQYLRMGESSGTTAQNAGSLGAAADGTYNALATTLGVAGAIVGDADTGVLILRTGGQNDAVTFTDFSATVLNGDFTIEAWIRPNAALAGQNTIFGVRGATLTRFFHGDEGTPTLSVVIADGSEVTTAPATVITPSVYQHVACVREGLQVTLYVNGVEVETQTLASAPTPAGVSGWGSDDNEPSQYPGRLDECAVYDYALTEEQLLAHYEMGAGI
jgi:hypothetical protein